MGKKKKMIIAGMAVIAVAAAVSAAVIINKNSADAVEIEGMEQAGEKDELSIRYGGSFDEFANTGNEDYNNEDYSKEAYSEEETVSGAGEDGGLSVEELQREKEKINKERQQEKEEMSKEFREAEGGDIWEGAEKSSDGGVKPAGDKTPSATGGAKAEIDPETGETVTYMKESDGYEEDKVICDAQSEEEAREIAGKISGTLLSWEQGVATIKVEGSVDELLEKLEKEGSDLKLYRKYKISE